jgi:hypothetical protein
MKKVEEAYKAFKSTDSYSYYDETHPLDIIIGIDEYGRESIIIRNEFSPSKIKKTNAIDISMTRYKEQFQLGFHLLDKNMKSIFFKFVEDLVETTKELKTENSMEYICERYELWKRLFYNGKNETLSESQILGLLGELVFLRDTMFKRHTYIDAINSWSGCDNTHKDFSIDNTWYEVKVTKVGSLTVKISSLNQLDSDSDGHLIVYEFEKMSESFHGLSLNTVVNSVLSLLTHDLQDKLIDKLKNAGYSYHEKYDEFSYRFINVNSYLVNQMFPKLSRKDIPLSIVKVEYELLKNEIYVFSEKE